MKRKIPFGRHNSAAGLRHFQIILSVHWLHVCLRKQTKVKTTWLRQTSLNIFYVGTPANNVPNLTKFFFSKNCLHSLSNISTRKCWFQKFVFHWQKISWRMIEGQIRICSWGKYPCFNQNAEAILCTMIQTVFEPYASGSIYGSQYFLINCLLQVFMVQICSKYICTHIIANKVHVSQWIPLTVAKYACTMSL